MTPPMGYAHPHYAKVYAELGEPVQLAASGGTVLRRIIPGTDQHDVMGCYPMFCCPHWEGLRQDLDSLRGDHVSLVLVADPFLEGGPHLLPAIFDRVKPFKVHYVADLTQPLASFVPKSRLRAGRKALRKLEVEITPGSAKLVDDWIELQDRSRHAAQLSGLNFLSRPAVERLFQLPDLVVLRAVHAGQTVGMHAEFHQDDVVFGHFAGYCAEGYRLGASTALHLCELEHFTGKARWIDWGGVPGTEDAVNGLSRFKQDFSNGTRMAFLCESVLNRKAYAALSALASCSDSSYFPSYRAHEQGRPRCAGQI